MRAPFVVLCLVAAAPAASAQTSAAASASSSAIAASVKTGPRPSDVSSMDSILVALYDVISGPAGQQRDWDRMRALFVPGAKLIPAVYRPDSVPSLRLWTVEEYITRVGPRLEEGGFFEREIARQVERYGGVVHVFSTYESRRKADDPKPFVRGINSIQLWHDGQRWWIVNIYWEGERPSNPIPAKYLTSAK